MTEETTTPEVSGPPQHMSLAAALAALQAELPKVVKGEVGEVSGQAKSGKDYRYTYTYADLADVTDALMPLMGKHGLSFTCAPRITDKGYILECKLQHTSGESETAEWMLPQNAGPQQIGSGITYGRRYCLTAMTGVAPRGDDDDAAKHQQQYQNYQQDRQEQAAAPADPRDDAFAELRSVVRTKGLGENNVPPAFAMRMGTPIGDATLEQIQEYTAFVTEHGVLTEREIEATGGNDTASARQESTEEGSESG